uniref:Uncharacterized protein n=1 Tax=Nelumbo nucifera TaxID=4432 RepID=A0A822YTA4_NELNU|nr:TPA_asm: hypothetical protein HUJ06_005431 [Nelumbo nucifera]
MKGFHTTFLMSAKRDIDHLIVTFYSDSQIFPLTLHLLLLIFFELSLIEAKHFSIYHTIIWLYFSFFLFYLFHHLLWSGLAARAAVQEGKRGAFRLNQTQP